MFDWTGNQSVGDIAVVDSWESVEGGQGAAPPINASCLVLSPTQGIAITPQTMVAIGGAGGPYAFSAVGLPTGLTLSAGGTLSGTPTVSGVFPYTVLIVDVAATVGAVNCSLTVAPAAAVSAACLVVSATVGTPISPDTMFGTGGLGGPYTFSAVGLPPGLSLSSSGILSGTPTLDGVFSYVVTILDVASMSGTANCSITVNPVVPVPTTQVIGSDPSIELSYSDDGGQTFSAEMPRSLGKAGQYRTRIYWNRLGSAYDRDFQVTWDAPVKIAITNAILTINNAPVDFKAFLGPSYAMWSPKAEVQRSLNCRRQRVETDQGVNPFVLLRALGMIPLAQPSGTVGVFRGAYELNNFLYVVIDSTLYLLNPDYSIAVTEAGLSNDGLPVKMAASDTALIIISAKQMFRYDGALTTPTLTFTPIDIANIDTYFVALSDINQQFYFSSDDGVTWSAGQVQSAEAEASNMLALIVHMQTLYIYGNRITQAFIVGPNALAPFQAQDSGVIPFGIFAVNSLKALGIHRLWLGQNHEGAYVVYLGEGYGVKPISNHAVESKIRQYARDFGVSDAIGQAFQIDGEQFYRLVFPAADTTWELNLTITLTTGVPEWNEVASWDYQLGLWHRHRANVIVSAFGKILAGDFANGWLYEMSPDAYTDAGYPLPGLRRAPHLLNQNKLASYGGLELGMEPGVGLIAPLWLQTYSMDAATFAAALAAQVGLGNVTADQAIVLQNIYDLVPYIPLNPYPSPDTMNTLGFTPWGGQAVLGA